ncbi:hypothetical protein Glove_35g6 [Diversispora epigaea]|uniref:Uncharacterized protein n=1 Tax=Diversispora epigaea TaxID=1348612 RepID=A0A397JR72_9GLOM|nr:hypothetical protein Glove_35g6 [Diversispora epigaea]
MYSGNKEGHEAEAEKERKAEVEKGHETETEEEVREYEENGFCINLKKLKYLKNPKSILETCIIGYPILGTDTTSIWYLIGVGNSNVTENAIAHKNNAPFEK